MAGGRNHESKAVRSQYFTPIDESEEFLAGVVEHLDANELSALEPAAGSGNLIIASQFGIPAVIDWTTNDLYPDNCNWDLDYTEDFLSEDFSLKKKFDVVITNPPFSGKVDYRGMKTDLVIAFIYRSFEFADTVAMILPANYMRPYYRSLLPDGVQITSASEPHFVVFGTPNGDKAVRVVQVIFEKTGKSERKLWPMSKPIPGFKMAANYEEATHAVCLWGAAGAVRRLPYEFSSRENRAWTYEVPVIMEGPWQFHLEENSFAEMLTKYSPLNSTALKTEELWDYAHLYIDWEANEPMLDQISPDEDWDIEKAWLNWEPVDEVS